MNRIERAFQKKAFIPFVTAGDPNLDFTEELICRMGNKGVDLIEIGIPFSDPVAEGPVIERADGRALKAGTTTDGIFAMVERIRRKSDVGLVFMTYMNPVYVYGVERFLQRSKEVGIDGIIIPDLPYEERMEVLPYCESYGIELISLVAPTSKERMVDIVTNAKGFLYCVSSLGVTGVRKHIGEDIYSMVSEIRKISTIPCAIGFGISTPTQGREMATIGDGVIVGSAIVQMIEEYKEDAFSVIEDYIQSMIEAINIATEF